jgi:hypothetical protein
MKLVRRGQKPACRLRTEVIAPGVIEVEPDVLEKIGGDKLVKLNEVSDVRASKTRVSTGGRC